MKFSECTKTAPVNAPVDSANVRVNINLEPLSVTLFSQFIAAFSALPLGLLLRGFQNQARDGKCAAVLVDGHHHHVGTVDYFPNAGRKLFHVRVDAHLH